MSRKRTKVKGRRESGTFLALPHAILRSKNYINLSPKAIKLLIDLAMQFNGSNNGDYCKTWKIMKKRGWKSNATLHEALKELMYYGFIVCTRQGGRHQASLYAVTWLAIDQCKGKLDINETRTPPGDWKIEKNCYKNNMKERNKMDYEQLIKINGQNNNSESSSSNPEYKNVNRKRVKLKLTH